MSAWTAGPNAVSQWCAVLTARRLATRDSKADILWRYATRGEVWMWLTFAPTTRAQVYIGSVPDVGYQIIR